MKKKISGRFWVFFWILLLIMIIMNFIGKGIFGLTHFWWHLFLHTGIIIFSFGILIYSLKLNEIARKYIVIGSVILIIVESIFFMSHIFEEYNWLQTNAILIISEIISFFVLMKGFKGGEK